MYTEEKLEELIKKEYDHCKSLNYDVDKVFVHEFDNMGEAYAVGRYHALTHVSDFDGNPPTEDDLYFVNLYKKYFNGRE